MRDTCQRFHRGPHHEKSQELAPDLVEASSLPNVAHGMQSGLQHTHRPRSPERPDKRANHLLKIPVPIIVAANYLEAMDLDFSETIW